MNFLMSRLRDFIILFHFPDEGGTGGILPDSALLGPIQLSWTEKGELIITAVGNLQPISPPAPLNSSFKALND